MIKNRFEQADAITTLIKDRLEDPTLPAAQKKILQAQFDEGMAEMRIIRNMLQGTTVDRKKK